MMQTEDILYATSLVLSVLLSYNMFVLLNKAHAVSESRGTAVVASQADVEDAVARSLYKRRDSRGSMLSGAFVYDVNIVDMSTVHMTLIRGERMANNLYIHFMSDVVNTIVVPGIDRPYAITGATMLRGESKLRFDLAASPALMNFVTPPTAVMAATTATTGYKQVLAMGVSPP